MNLWVDDIRRPPGHRSESFTWVKSYGEAIGYLETGLVETISLDHDLGLCKTGYDVVCWIERAVVNGDIECPLISCHSMNPVGRQKIQIVIDRLMASVENCSEDWS